jgi:hypothetical protein
VTITIIPYDNQDIVETFEDDDFELVERLDDGSILVRIIATGETRHLDQVSLH